MTGLKFIQPLIFIVFCFWIKSMAGFGIVIGDLNLKEMGFNGFINIR